MLFISRYYKNYEFLLFISSLFIMGTFGKSHLQRHYYCKDFLPIPMQYFTSILTSTLFSYASTVLLHLLQSYIYQRPVLRQSREGLEIERFLDRMENRREKLSLLNSKAEFHQPGIVKASFTKLNCNRESFNSRSWINLDQGSIQNK